MSVITILYSMSIFFMKREPIKNLMAGQMLM